MNNQSGSSSKKKRNKPIKYKAISSKKIKKVEIKDDKFGNLIAISEEMESGEVNSLKIKNQANLRMNNFI